LASKAAQDREWVTLALLTGPRGIRGEIQAVPFSDKAERFQRLKEVSLFGAEGMDAAPLRLEVESVWEHRGRAIFKFRGVDSISDAERLRGKEVRIPLEERPPLPEGEYYQSDLVGCEVVERASGVLVGRVKGWQDCGGPGLLEVAGADGKEILVPFAGSICVEIDTAARRIRVDLPEGLKDING
jgi:16S rRNA processing protein RimM